MPRVFRSRSRFPWVVAVLSLAFAQERGHAQEQPGASPEINESFRDPDVEQFVGRFETESREVFARRGRILEALDLEPGMAVADVGAGTGLFTHLFAERVGPGGTVFAVDIAPGFLKHIASRAEKEGQPQVTPVLGTQTSTHLPAKSVDLVFICDTYHHFEQPAETMSTIHRALVDDGQLVVIDFDRREGARPFVLEHVRAAKEVFFAEIEAVGFERFDFADPPSLEENFIARFRKVERPAAGGEARP